MVMIEAMACGTPVVALRAGSVPEVVAPGISGVICDDPADLPGAIDRASAIDPVDCRMHVARHFTSERLARGYARAYRTAMSRLLRTTAEVPQRFAGLRVA
jgi:glycosyltransferase involved in cell wall biosynthesis